MTSLLWSIAVPLRAPLGARVAVVLLLCLGFLVAGAPAALAHGRSSDATNMDSAITRSPDIPGVEWRIYGGDEFLSVTNTSAAELLVLGYEGEPYLRVGPDGVFENRLSPAAYINDERLGTEVPPGVTVDPGAAPDWRKLGDGQQALWHDHRIHWMAPEPPRPTEGATGPVTVYERWEVPVRYEGTERLVVGTLTWVPGPNPLPWLAVALVLTAPAAIGLRTRPAGERWPAAVRPAAVVLGVVAAANLTHLVDDLFAVPLPWGTLALAALQTALFIVIGLLGAVKGWQAGEGAFTALGVGSASILMGQGLLYLPALAASQTTSLLPDVWSRLLISVSIMQALWVGLVAVIGTRATMPPAPARDAEDPVASSGSSTDAPPARP